MEYSEIIRNWKDPKSRGNAPAVEAASCPDHPAGVTEIAEEELELVFGAMPPTTARCPTFTLRCW